MTIYADLPPVDDPTAAPHRNRWSRRRWIVSLIAGVVAFVLVGAGIGWLIYINSYQPIGEAGFGQDAPTMRQNMKIITDHVGNYTYVAVGQPGTLATTDYTIANNGRFDIKIIGAGPNDLGLRLSWAPPIQLDAQRQAGAPPEYPADARPFPATISAHQPIQLFVTVPRGRCPNGGTYTLHSVPIRWQALGVHHVTMLSLASDSNFFPIALCAPAAALRLATEGRE